ncbi:MAG: hypothetical protein HXX10_01120 [Rhodoplanes sp.]|uniref:hypothetical protein n=1 Tax=Rhodoplanes sp. TaxID=1968906 RepID=UPI00184C89D1|nr:hypothetical protein [Rhodoplanes sp.]NVO12614.1 hypothetical protein [Rhodoplanes sp.]
MKTYEVRFFKTLLSSDGHAFRCLQDSLEITNARSAKTAIVRAERQYEKLHNVSTWDRWADSVDISEMTACPMPPQQPEQPAGHGGLASRKP